MSDKRTLNFETEAEAIAEIQRLRGGHRLTGRWTLPQICYHVAVPLKGELAPPVPMDLARTPEQEAMKAGFVDFILAERRMKPEWQAAGEWIPPATCGEADVDTFVSLLEKLRDYPHPRVVMGPIGPVSIEEFRGVNLAHAAHHLSHLIPSGD